MAFLDEFLSSDELLGALMPIVVYWAYSGLYSALGSFSDKYRIHPKQDVDEKNLVTKVDVIKGVLLQQFLQVLAIVLLYMVAGTDPEEAAAAEPTPFIVIARQFIVAMLILDTYQSFLHKYLHQNKFLYKHLHAQHHRLVVPYTYGAIYSHPLEGFLFDTVGGSLAFVLSGMSARTSIYFFSFGTIKTVDDHCGIMIPGNPFHILFRNSTAYHDFHHQLPGNKYNFSQPFFAIWDRVWGTYVPYMPGKKVDEASKDD